MEASLVSGSVVLGELEQWLFAVLEWHDMPLLGVGAGLPILSGMTVQPGVEGV